MNEQFIMLKHGASFHVNRKGELLTIKALQPGNLYPLICNLVATSQHSIAQFYLAEQKWKGQPGNLMNLFSEKGWMIEKAV